MLHNHSRFLLLLALFIAGAFARQLVLPAMEGSDEHLHYNYVEWLRRENRLPERANYLDNSTVQESGQPPLAYWLYSLPMRLLNRPAMDGPEVLDHLRQVKNRWISPHNPWNRTDNLNIYYHGANGVVFGQPDLVDNLRVMRLFSILFGMVAVIGAYGAAGEIFAQKSWQLTAAALFALMPTMISLGSYVTNDVGVVAFTTLATWQALRILRLGASPKHSLILGLLLGCAALSKVSALLVAPGVILAIFLSWLERRQAPINHASKTTRFQTVGLSLLFVNLLICGWALALLFLPWVAYGVLTFQDPFGTRTHYDPLFRHDPLLTLPEIALLMPRVFRTYLGYGSVYMHPAVYGLFGVLVISSMIGFMLGTRFSVSAFINKTNIVGAHGRAPLRNPKNLFFQQSLVLIAIFLGVFVGLIRWLSEYLFIDGRLLYPAHIAIVIGLTVGLYLLAHRFPLLTRPLQLGTVGLVAVTGIITAPVRVYAAYAPPPRLQRDQLPTLQGGVIDYEGIIRFLGQTQEEAIITPNDIHAVTLCWEVLQATERPAAFSLKFVHGGDIVADRTSVFGMGRFNSVLWQPGDIFCDRVEVFINDPDLKEEKPPVPGQTYDMLLVLLDAQTLDVNWKAYTPDGTYIQFPFIGQVIAAASDTVSPP